MTHCLSVTPNSALGHHLDSYSFSSKETTVNLLIFGGYRNTNIPGVLQRKASETKDKRLGISVN